MSNRTTVIVFAIVFALLVTASSLVWSDMPEPAKKLIYGVALIIAGVVVVAAEAHRLRATPSAPLTREAKIGIALILSGCTLFLGTVIFTEFENL